MPSRMEKYYKSNDIKRRTTKNQDLYRTIYDEAEYSNVEGISVIEKNEKIDIDMIRELINKNNKPVEHKEVPKASPKVEEIVIEEEKNYDIRDILNKAKSERVDSDSRFANTQYNILKNISLNEEFNASKKIDDDELKNMIEKISNNSKGYQTSDLFDDLKSICDPEMRNNINEQMVEEESIDKSFYTSSLGFTNDDFEDLKDMKDTIKANNILTKVLLFILIFIVVAGVLFFIYYKK